MSGNKKWYVYLVRCKTSNKMYVGQHVTRHEKIQKMVDDGYYGSGILIQNALKAYGKKDFIKTIMYIADSQNEADFVEVDFIKTMKVLEQKDKWYNRSSGGQKNRPNDHSERMSEIMTNMYKDQGLKDKVKKIVNSDRYREGRNWPTVKEMRDRKLAGMRIHLINRLKAVINIKKRNDEKAIAKVNGYDSFKKYKQSIFLKTHNDWQKTPLARAAMSTKKLNNRRIEADVLQ